MTSIEERILSYASLSDAERNEVQVFVNANPEWYPLLNDVKHLASAMPLPDEAASTPEDAMLAYYLTATYLEPHGTWSRQLRNAFRRLEQRIDDDADFAERARTFRERLQAAEDAVDPIDHFHSLTASSNATDMPTDAPGPDASSRSSGDSSAERATSADPVAAGEEAGEGASREGASGENAAGDDKPERGRVLGWVARWPQAVQWGFALFLIGALLAAAAWGIDRATRSPLDRLAALDVSETRIEGYRMNVSDSLAASDSVSTDRLFLRALTTFREARTTTLGLFPRYHDPTLQDAMTQLETVVDREPAGSFLALEARFFLAKAHLAQEQTDAARAELQVLARRDNRRAAEAVKLLQDLQRVAPMAEPDAPASPYDE
jgi:hypothetical protein